MLEEVKAKLGILQSDSDEHLKSLIQEGTATLMMYCGPFDVDTNLVGRKLVGEYVRFHFNGVGEEFYPRYRPEIIQFGFELAEIDEESGRLENF